MGITRLGGDVMRPGERLVWPPPLPPPIRRDQPIAPASQSQISAAIAVVATLDIEALAREHVGDGLPPAIQSAFTVLGPPDWTTICLKAIRGQSQLLREADGANRGLRRDEPWLLAEFLPTMRS